MSVVIPVAHDIVCPWCYVGIAQVRRLEKEFGVSFDWIGYELYPEHGYELYPEPMPFDDGSPPPPLPPANKPKTPSRFQLMLAAEGMELPKVSRPYPIRSHDALASLEFAKAQGDINPLLDRLYAAYWSEGQDIGQRDVVLNLAAECGLDRAALAEALEDRRFAHLIVPFDDGAHEKGVWNVPTFWIGEERYAEQPYRVLAKALREHLGA